MTADKKQHPDWLKQVEKIEADLPAIDDTECVTDPKIVAPALKAIADKLEEK
jgi:hypothetical protein